MLDVSKAVDLLFGGVVPERVEELKAIWNESDRVRLLEVDYFLLQASYETIQVGEKALRQIWLVGYAAWSAIEAYNVRLIWERVRGARFDPVAWNAYAQQAPLDAEFDRLLGEVRRLGDCATLEDFDWPEGVPKPVEGLRIADPAKKATFDFVCMAGAFVFAHELRHVLLFRDNERPDELIEEERECDRWALALLLDGVPDYPAASGEDLHAVHSKRVLGAIFAQLAIVALTPRKDWNGLDGHPPVAERMRAVLDAAGDEVPEWFWVSVASMLTAFARALGALPPAMPFPPTYRDLAYVLCEGLR